MFDGAQLDVRLLRISLVKIANEAPSSIRRIADRELRQSDCHKYEGLFISRVLD